MLRLGIRVFPEWHRRLFDCIVLLENYENNVTRQQLFTLWSGSFDVKPAWKPFLVTDVF